MMNAHNIPPSMATTASFSLATVFLTTSRRPFVSLSSHHHHLRPLRRTTAITTASIKFPFPRRRRTLTTTNLTPPPTDSKPQQPINVHQSDEPQEEELQQQQQQSPPFPPTSPEKRSFALATAEVFLGIASRLIKTFKRQPVGDGESPTSSSVSVPIWDSSERNLSYRERIGAVVEDSLDPEVVWEQRVKDVEAEKKRKKVTSPGFSFSAAGLLFPYHLGVAKCLIEKGYIKETTPLAGSSAGAIICAVVACGKSMEEALELTKELAEDCRLRGTAFRLGAVLRQVLEKTLPDDAHIRCNGRVRVAVTQVFWRPRGLLVDQFDSKEDLINAVFTSSFVPGYLAPQPATLFRNQLCVDGGLTLFMPPTSATQTVRVCAFPASSLRLQGIGISPDCNPENKLSTRQLFNWALEPAEDSMLDKLYEFGYRDASVWAEQNPVESIVEQDES